MAVDSNIGSLPAAASIEDDSLLVAEQQGEAKHFTGKQLKDYAKQGVDALVAAAQKAADDAAQAARDAKAAADSVQDVSADAAAAKAAAQAATQAMLAAQNARDAAQLAATLAADDAATKTAQSVENKLAGYVTDAENAKSAAQSAAGTAATDAANAVNSQLAQHVADAQAAQKAAEDARDQAQAIAGGDFLPLAGGTMTGPITLAGDPTENLHAAPKRYVDKKSDKENPVFSGVFTLEGKGAGNTDVILQIRSNNGMLTGASDASSAFHFAGVPVYFDTLVFFGQGFSFPTPGGTLTGNFTQLKGFSNSEFRAGTTNYVETGCNYGAFPAAERQNFIVKNVDPEGGTGDNWSYQAFNQAADGTWERVFGVKADGTIVSKGEEITPGGGFSGGYVDGSISPNSDALNLGELGKAWYQLFAKIVYFFDASAQNSQYAFGMYQWGDNYTFVVRDAATNGYIADLWQINGATRVTNFNVKPTVAGKELVTTDDLNNAVGNINTILDEINGEVA